VTTDEVVVDASLALKWIEREPYSEEASELLEKWQKQRRRLTAPALFAYEATNALAKRVKRGQLTLEAAKERLASLLENGPALESDVALNLRALEIMERFSLPSAYDAHYLALAESRQCECWTADERIWNTVKRELAWVRWVGQRATADIG
jgi:predicted nucleic acid-binding protein